MFHLLIGTSRLLVRGFGLDPSVPELVQNFEPPWGHVFSHTGDEDLAIVGSDGPELFVLFFED